jgi:hypothetical protein
VELCGRLIGRQGVHVDYIRQKTQVDLVVRDDAVSFEKQVVALHGLRNKKLFVNNKNDLYRSSSGCGTSY